MVESAALLFRERGYSGTGFRDVIEHSGAPRGSIYHHFPGGKSELAAETMRYAGDVVAARIERAAADGDPAAVLRAFVALVASARSRDSDFRAGCPVVAVAVEAHDETRSSRPPPRRSPVGAVVRRDAARCGRRPRRGRGGSQHLASPRSRAPWSCAGRAQHAAAARRGTRARADDRGSSVRLTGRAERRPGHLIGRLAAAQAAALHQQLPRREVERQRERRARLPCCAGAAAPRRAPGRSPPCPGRSEARRLPHGRSIAASRMTHPSMCGCPRNRRTALRARRAGAPRDRRSHATERVGQRVALRVEARAGQTQGALVGEVAVERVPLHARPLRDRAEARLSGADRAGAGRSPPRRSAGGSPPGARRASSARTSLAMS